jgi:hypothetical protein
MPPFVVQLPHVSIFDPPSLFSPAGCRVANIRTTSASRRAASEAVIVITPHHAIAIIVDFVACRVVAIGDGDTFLEVHVCAFTR